MGPAELAEVISPIRQEIEARDAETLPGEGLTRVYLHGHSGGGLVIARILEAAATDPDAAFIANRVTRATTIGSPFGGSLVADLVMENRGDHPLGGETLLEDVKIQNLLADLVGNAGAEGLEERVGPLTSRYMSQRWQDAPTRTVPIGTIGTGLWSVPLAGPGGHPTDYSAYFFGSTMGHNGPEPLSVILDRSEIIAGLLADLVPDQNGNGTADTDDLFSRLETSEMALYDVDNREIVVNASTLAKLGPKAQALLESRKNSLIDSLASEPLVSWWEATVFVNALLSLVDLRIDLGPCQVASSLTASWYESCRDDLFLQLDEFLAWQGPLWWDVTAACAIAFQPLDPLNILVCPIMKKKIFKEGIAEYRTPFDVLTTRDLLPSQAGSLTLGARSEFKCTDGIVPCISSLGEMLATTGARVPGPIYPLGFVGANHVRAMFNTPVAIARFDSNGVLQAPEYPIRIGEWYLREVICDGTPIPQLAQEGGTVVPDLDAIRHECTVSECYDYYQSTGDEPPSPDPCPGSHLCEQGAYFDLSDYAIAEAGGDWARPCQPLSCGANQCGNWSDGCGGTIYCGPCASACPKGTCVCDTPQGPVCEDENGLCPNGMACEPE
ncbi:MAG TPA: hypothetical protein ENI85_16245 [Deltaproteobacteria bacterium]|nr:hypothetical protein [Deltaproteobacteria bacterium]